MNPDTPPEEGGKEKFAVRSSAADRMGYRLCLGDLPALEEQLGPESLRDGWDDLRSDIWQTLYRPHPEVRPAEEVRGDRQVNRRIVEKLMGREAYQRLHESTGFDGLKSAEATIFMADEIARWAEAEKERKENEGDHRGGQPDPDGPGGFDPNGAAAERVKEALENCEKVNDLLGQMAGKGHIENACERVETFKQMGSDASFIRLATMVGRMEISARRITESACEQHGSEVTDFELGNDLSHVMPIELARLDDPDLENAFLADWAMKRLTQYKTRSDQSMERGPMVVLMDRSGSMAWTTHDHDDHTPRSERQRLGWAKAVALALVAIARRQRRDVTVIPFDDVPDRPITFRRGENPAGVKMLAGTRTGGGTSFCAATTAAFTIIAKSEAYRRADVVLITDGLDEMHLVDPKNPARIIPGGGIPLILAEKKRLNARIWGVQVGDCGVTCLEKICDQVAAMKDGEDSILRLIFGKATR